MKLYFLRHAEASNDAVSDHERPLTERGIERTRAAGLVIKRMGLTPKFIYSSPRLRARQTAEIVAEALDMTIEVRDEVDFSFSLKSVKALIKQLKSGDEAMFVGHNPSMSEVVNRLTGASVSMKKGGLARVDVFTPSSPRGELVWLIAPKVFDALGGDAESGEIS